MAMDSTPERLPDVDPAIFDDRRRASYDQIVAGTKRLPFRSTDDDGRLMGMFRVFAHAPVTGQCVVDLGYSWRDSRHITLRMREIAILATAAWGKADYVWYSHWWVSQGVLSEEELAALHDRRALVLSDCDEQAAHDVVRALLDTGDLDDALYQRAIDAVGHDGVTELIWIIGVYQIDALQLRVHRLGAPAGRGAPAWD